MLRPRFGSLVRKIVRVALASSVGATTYACSDSKTDAAAGDGAADGGDATNGFADEATFACEAPLPGVLETLSPAVPVDYLELREQLWKRGGLSSSEDAGPSTAPMASATRGTPCATATNKDACISALSALAPVDDTHGWYTDGDISGDRPGASRKQFVVFTRGDTVGALYSTAEVASFLGSIDSLEEARLVLQSMNQPLVCATDPRKSGWRKNDDGSWELLVTGTACGTLIKYRNRYRVALDGTVTSDTKNYPSSSGPICGRRPAGLAPTRASAGSPYGIAAHFVEAAYLEAASVVAFRRLELELHSLGAPESLARRARRARREEIDHARETARLARRYGGVTPVLDVPAMTRRTLVAIATENAVEGCVRETYGALVAAFQAERAAPDLRPLLRRIARDEARHAELAHDVADWMDRKLSPMQRAQVATARERAVAELFEAAEREPDADVIRIAGMPTATEARMLLEGLQHAFFAAARAA
jgi:hypothetical protein